MKRILLFLFFFCVSCSPKQVPEAISFDESKSAVDENVRTYFLIEQNKIDDAIATILEAPHDRLICVEPLAIKILQNSIASGQGSDALMALQAIPLCRHEAGLALIEEALSSDMVEIQLAAVVALKAYDSSSTASLLKSALHSDSLLVRLEALYELASIGDEDAFAQIESLFLKVEPEFRPLFVELFAVDHSPQSIHYLNDLVYDSNADVACSAIICLAKLNQFELCHNIKRLTFNPSRAIQEASAFAISTLQDKETLEFLRPLLKCGNPGQLYAAKTLLQANLIEDQARKDNLFAISFLGGCSGGEKVLIEKLNSESFCIRLNAAMSLLQKRNSACVPVLAEFLIPLPGYHFLPVQSPGKSLSYIKVCPKAKNLNRFFDEISLQLRQEALVKALELESSSFLELTEALLKTEQLDLVNLTVRLLENQNSESAKLLLEKHAQHLGNPFIRIACQAALYRLHDGPDFEESLSLWIKQTGQTALFGPRPLIPWMMQPEKKPIEENLHWQAMLFVEVAESLAQSKKEKAIISLLETLKVSSSQNKPLIAALLLRALE